MNIRREVASRLREMADEIEGSGSCVDVGFTIFEYDVITEETMDCLDVTNDIDEAYAMLGEAGKKRSAELYFGVDLRPVWKGVTKQ